MSEAPRRILVDTNVWLDYFIPSRRGRSVAIEFLRDACTAQVDLLYAATSSKDLFYLISSEHKAWYRREHGSLSQDAAVADITCMGLPRRVVATCHAGTLRPE